MRVKEISDFESLSDSWNNLLKRNMVEDNIFLTWEWLSIWWKHFGKTRKLLLLAVKENNEILALAPLMLSKYKLPRFGAMRRIEFIGSPHSDYHNLIIIKEKMKCLKNLLIYIIEEIKNWDWVELKEINEHTPTVRLLRALAPNSSTGLTFVERVCNICPYIPLYGSFDILMKNLTKNMRQNINKYLRRINRDFKNVSFKRYDKADFSVKEAMKVFIKLHQKRWNSQGLPGAFANEKFRDFHLEIADLFDRRGWLGLYFLMVNDEPVSAQYTFEYKLKVYYYLAGFNPEFSDYSVGNLTTMFLLKECIKRGFKEYDMMRGDEPYKMFWTDKCRKNIEVRLVKKNLQSRFYNWLTWSNVINEIAGKLKLTLKENSVH